MKTFNNYLNESKEEVIVVDKHRAFINDYGLVKGDKVWLKDGKFHRENGPAIERANGDKLWFINGKIHRENSPAIEHPNGTKEWWSNGKIHRIDGPAIEGKDGYKEWVINNKRMSDWLESEIKLLIANNNIKNIMKYSEIREELKKFKHLLKPEDRILFNLNWGKKI